MSERLSISRSDLVDIATEAMKDSGITREQHIEMCETAHTMKRVLLGAWVKNSCACLVGTTYRNELSKDDVSYMENIRRNYGMPMVEVGMRFDRKLSEHLGTNPAHCAVVTVVDD